MSVITDFLKTRAIERLVRAMGATSLTPVLMSLIDNHTVSLETLLGVVSTNPWVVLATPLIMAVAKELRMRYGDKAWMQKLVKYVPL